jgi:hypothetical protein
MVIAIAVFLAGSGFLAGPFPSGQQQSAGPAAIVTQTFTVPEHYISPEYFRNSSPPPPPPPEPTMITIVISRNTFDQLSLGKRSGIIRIPVAYLDFQENFVNSTAYPTWHFENGLAQHDRIAIVRMPVTMYDRIIKEVPGEYLDLSVSSFVRQYDSLYALRQQLGDAANESVIAGNTKKAPTLPAIPDLNRTETQNILITPTTPETFPG